MIISFCEHITPPVRYWGMGYQERKPEVFMKAVGINHNEV